MPLDVDKGIELPQLELISTKNDDCTTVYSTGKQIEIWYSHYFTWIKIPFNIMNIFIINVALFREIHMSRGRIQIQTSIRILSLPHLRANLFDCNHVLDILLD